MIDPVKAKAKVKELNQETVLRIVALTMAIWSHGPQPGHESDNCFPARAKRFLEYLETGK